MEFWVNEIFNAISYAGLLFLLGGGMTLIFGAMKIVNIAHGTLFLVGGYVGYVVWRYTGNFFFGLLGASVVVGVIGMILERFLLRELSGQLLRQMLMTMGSKDAIAKLALAVLDPGDLAVAPVPGYPTYNIGHVFAGAVTCQVPLRKENRFLIDFDAIPLEVRRQAKLLWLNYPNNPTTAVAPMEFFQRAVAFGRENDILIASDAAYTENTYDGYQAPSILQVDGAEEVAVELFSMSKAFCMTGWRIGCMVGNASAVAALNAVKENIDNGSLRAIQFAAATALNQAERLIPPINEVYRRRRDLVIDALNANGWSLEKTKATIYVWAPVPERYEGDSGAFVADLLEKTGVMVTPGRGYGRWGEGYFRISLTYPDEVLAEAMGRIVEMKL